VIEKCSFCVQRIQEGKLTAKKESRQLNDGDVKTACQTACPTSAITFGNKNDKHSKISHINASELNYLVLEEVNVASNVTYSAKIINKDEKLEA
jgi:molybdopterin-containing oxidoreductase family iron-sulfur binding subunit